MLAERAVLNVARNADDFKERPFRPLEAQAFAQRVFARPECVGQRLVDDRDGGRAFAVCVRELAPAHEMRAHRLEISGPDDVEADARAVVSALRGSPFGDDLHLRV